MPFSEQDSATEGVPQTVEDTMVPNAFQPIEFTPVDTPVRSRHTAASQRKRAAWKSCRNHRSRGWNRTRDRVALR